MNSFVPDLAIVPKLAQKNIAVAVQRMNHEVQQLLDLGLKG